VTRCTKQGWLIIFNPFGIGANTGKSEQGVLAKVNINPEGDLILIALMSYE